MKIGITEYKDFVKELLEEYTDKRIVIVTEDKNEIIDLIDCKIPILDFNDIKLFNPEDWDLMIIFKPNKLIYEYSQELNNMEETPFKCLLNILYSELTCIELRKIIFDFSEDNFKFIQIRKYELLKIIDSYEKLNERIQDLNTYIDNNKIFVKDILNKL